MTPTTPRRGLTLALISVAQLMIVLDFSIVNVALPAIQRDLGFAPADLHWTISAYALALGGFLLLGGRAADLLGRRRMFVWGIGLFTLASLLGGFATAPWALIAARVLQGIGGAVVAPALLAIVSTGFPEGEARNRAFGILGTTSAVGFSIGMILGGVLTDGLGWAWVFFVNVPIGAALIALAPRALPPDSPRPSVRGFDLAGAVTVTAGLALLVHALSAVPQAGWTGGTTLASLGLAAALLGLFLWIETRVKAPLVPLGLFRRRGVVGANLVGLGLAGAVAPLVLTLTLDLQGVRGYSALLTGLAFLPHGLPAVFASRPASALITRFGPRAVVAGGALLLASAVAMMAGFGGAGYWALLPGLILSSPGLIAGFIGCIVAGTSGVPAEEQGLISGLLATTQQVGAALGVAVLAGLALGAAGLPAADGVRLALAAIAGLALAVAVLALLLLPSLRPSGPVPVGVAG